MIMPNPDPHIDDRALADLTSQELEEERLSLLVEINSIQSQLTSRKVKMEEEALTSGQVNQHGKPINDPAAWAEYHRWRAAAIAALHYKSVEMAEVKVEIKHRATTGGGQDLVPMLSQLYAVARSLEKRLGQARPEEVSIMEHVQRFLEGR